MPFGHAVIAIEMMHVDHGDDTWNGEDWNTMMQYLEERLIAFTFSDSDRKIDKLEMVFRNDDYEMLDNPVFAKGQKLQICWGWPGRLTAPRRMIIKSVKGSDEIVVMAHGTLALLNKDKKHRFEEGVTDSEFVRKVAQDNGYNGDKLHIDETDERHDITQPKNWTDAKMMRKLANNNGFEFYIDETGLHWHKIRTDKKAIKNFIYRTDSEVGTIIESPVFEANLSKGVSRVKVHSFDPITKKRNEKSIGINDEIDVSLGNDNELYDTEDTDIGKRGKRISEEEFYSGGLMTENETKIRAKSIYRETAKGRYKMSMRIIGDHEVGAKQIIGLYGVSDLFDGLYYVKEAMHNISAGKYEIELKCQKDAVNKVNVSKKRPKNSNVNKHASDEKPEEEKDPELKRILSVITDSEGRVTTGHIFVDEKNSLPQSSELTPDQISNLNERQLESLFRSGAQSTLPDV